MVIFRLQDPYRSEALRNAQECERKAWGIQDKAETEVSGGLSITWEK